MKNTSKTQNKKNNTETEETKKILLIIVVTIFILLGFFLFFTSLTGGIVSMLIGLLIIPKVNIFLNNKIEAYNKKPVKISIFVLLFFILFSVFNTYNLNNSTQDEDQSYYLGTIQAKTGTMDAKLVTDFSYTLGKLLLAYRDARLLEEESLNVKYEEMTIEEHQAMLELIEINYEEVNKWAKEMEKFKEFATDEIVYIPIKKSSLIEMVEAQGFRPEDIMSDPVPVQMPGTEEVKKITPEVRKAEQKAMAKYKEQLEEKWQLASLIKAAYPTKKWIDIVSRVFQEDSGAAMQRLRERSAEMNEAYKNETAYYDKIDKWKLGVSTGCKVLLFVAGAPGAIATGGVLAATSIFIGGIDVGISVGKSVDVIVNGKDPAKWQGVEDTMGPVFMLTNIANLIKNPKTWDYENLLFLNDLVLGGLENSGNISVNVNQNKSIDVYQGDISNNMKFPGGIDSGNQYLPDYLNGSMNTRDKQRAEAERKAQIKALKEFLQRPEVQEQIQKRLEKKKKELEAAQKEAARKEAALKKIRDQKEQERARAKKKQAADAAKKKLEAQRKRDAETAKVLEELSIPEYKEPEPEPVPEPTPPPPDVPKVNSGQIVNDCNLCWKNNMACSCGTYRCRCCPNDPNSDCNAFDL